MVSIKSTTGLLKITEVDENILSGFYFARCMDCAFCHDICCSYGCPVDITEVLKILAYHEILEQMIGKPASEWFHLKPDDRPEFPSGKVLRTQVYNNKCVFYNFQNRGCRLHSLALEMGKDPHQLKPMVCFLFPITWDGTYLHVAEFLDELPCKNQGTSIFESQKTELIAYMGNEFVSEIEKIKAPKPDIS